MSSNVRSSLRSIGTALLAVSLAMPSFLGCDVEDPEAPTDDRESRLSIAGGPDRFAHIRLRVTEHAPRRARLGVWSSTNEDGYSVEVFVESSQLCRDASFVAAIGSTSLEPGVAFVTHCAGDVCLAAERGSVTFELVDGAISGSVDAVPASLSASFSGRPFLECSIVPTDRPQARPGELVTDGSLSSPICAPLRRIRDDSCP